MAPIWKGSISFGLVNIPVELAAAVRADNISFRMLDAESGSPVKYERVRASDGTPVRWDDIVKGFEYVTLASLKRRTSCCLAKVQIGAMRYCARP